MSINSSNILDASLPVPFICLKSRTAIFIFMFFSISYVLLLPLFCLVIFSAFQRRSWKLSNSSTSHSDFFTYNVICLELVCMFATCLFCVGTFVEEQTLLNSGLFVYAVSTPGQIFFHLLTCVERYLAVVHPVIYLGLKQAGGLRIRNISTACVWLMCLGLIVFVSVLGGSFSDIFNFCLLSLSLMVVTFCSFSILLVLRQPGPGQAGRDKALVDGAKQRAFQTIVAIMIAQLCKFVGGLVSGITYISYLMSPTSCVVGTCALLLTLPSSLVLPLVYLQRAGKLPGCKDNYNCASE